MKVEERKRIRTASEDFKSNMESGIRYVDKTELLIPLLDRDSETTFFLRPRRFGKTLALSMIQTFIEDTGNEELNAQNRKLFKGLKIMDAGEKYTSQMTSYSVIHLTFQTVKGVTLESSYRILREMIRKLFQSKKFLLESHMLDELDKQFFERILFGRDSAGREETPEDLMVSLKYLSEFLRKDSGRRTVVLIDEYDVPLENAYHEGYYNEMISLYGPMLQNVLKTNSENLQFAVVTGCLRIAKEGIYTGLNNPSLNTVLLTGKNDSFGFTENEVKNMLRDSGFADHFEEIRDWYDGYLFGNSTIYNPWSVIQHIEALDRDPDSLPQLYWAGTSGNTIIRELAQQADTETKNKIEHAMQGEEIEFARRDTIAYDELYDDPDNILNVLLSSGYLTASRVEADSVCARIPNREIHCIFKDQIASWFRQSLRMFELSRFYSAIKKGNADLIEQILTEEFISAMSYYDSVEAFYHGVLLALVQMNREYHVTSNRESGKGRFDIAAKHKTSKDLAFIFEVKITKRSLNMASAAKRGAGQIVKKKYFRMLQNEGYKTIMTYGIAFCEKVCKVVRGETFTLKN